MAETENFDELILGGGVIGLSLAFQLANVGRRVCVVDRQELGREASWAGAGIIPPGSWYHDHPTLESLARESCPLLSNWSKQLHAFTGIDNGWRQTGGIYFTPNFDCDPENNTITTLARWQQQGILSQPISAAELRELDPVVADGPWLTKQDKLFAYFVPEEAQLRNPRHLKALIAACTRLGVVFQPNTTLFGFVRNGPQITGIKTTHGRLQAGQFCLTAGCWTGKLAEQLELDLPIRPVAGQMILLKHQRPTPACARIHHHRGKYIVPRCDGYTLVGSTVEDIGFDKRTTASAIADLRALARGFGLGMCDLKQTWAGLRPASSDGLPYMGRLPGMNNGWLATGHFRAGLQLSAITAVAMAALMLDQEPPVDITALGVERLWHPVS
jgi:glycine oxidase